MLSELSFPKRLLDLELNVKDFDVLLSSGVDEGLLVGVVVWDVLLDFLTMILDQSVGLSSIPISSNVCPIR